MVDSGDKKVPTSLNEFISRIAVNPVRSRLLLRELGKEPRVVQFSHISDGTVHFIDVESGKSIFGFIMRPDSEDGMGRFIFDKQGVTFCFDQSRAFWTVASRFEYLENGNA